MGRQVRWQAILTLTGIAMTLAFLGFLSSSRTTVTIPEVGENYTEGITGIPQFINPLLAHYNPVDQDLTALIFNGLTQFDENGAPKPDLAQSWQVSDDGLVYQFKLKSDIRWQDGRNFSADDVLFTTALLQDPEFPGVPYLHRLWQTVTVEKLDAQTVRFTLTEPFPAFADFTTIGILPQHILQDVPAGDLLNHPFNLNPVGTGPFVLDEINAETARLSVNPHYTGPKPRLTQLDLRFYPTYQQTIAAYKAGQVQSISFIPPYLMPTVESIESLQFYSARLSGYEIVYLNLQAPDTVPFFEQVEVRQALLSGLNRQEIIDKALHGQGIVANSPIFPWSWAYNADQSQLEYNPDTANTLLAEAGWTDTNGDGIRDKDGRSLTFTLLCANDPDRLAVAEAVSEQWQKIGVAATVEIVETGLGEKLATHNFQAALAQVFLAGDPDPYPLWHLSQIDGGQNYAGWNHDRASMLLELARTITNKGNRNDYYFEFQEIFAQETPSLILFYPVYTYGVHQQVHDVQLSPMTNPRDRFRTLSNWYVLTRKVIEIYSEAQYPEIEPQNSP